MANGKPGDHPLTDVLVYDLPAFSAEVDALIRELQPFGVWKSQLMAFLILSLDGEMRLLRESGNAAQAETLLHNFAHTLRQELERLRSER